MNFRWGREDCNEESPITDAEHEFPEGSMTAREMFNYFSEGESGSGFSLSKREVAALLGAHTLGKADTANSGYGGPWVAGETRVFDNQYYKLMAEKKVYWRKRVDGPFSVGLDDFCIVYKPPSLLLERGQRPRRGRKVAV